MTAMKRRIKTPIDREALDAAKKLMMTKTVAICNRILDNLEQHEAKASYSQLGVVYGILRDKLRLDMGEPTSKVEHVTRVDIERLSDLATRLKASLHDGDG